MYRLPWFLIKGQKGDLNKKAQQTVKSLQCTYYHGQCSWCSLCSTQHTMDLKKRGTTYGVVFMVHRLPWFLTKGHNRWHSLCTAHIAILLTKVLYSEQSAMVLNKGAHRWYSLCSAPKGAINGVVIGVHIPPWFLPKVHYWWCCLAVHRVPWFLIKGQYW